MNRHPAGPKPNPQSPTMRASLLHGIRDLRLEELARPTPGPDEVLLQVACVGAPNA